MTSRRLSSLALAAFLVVPVGGCKRFSGDSSSTDNGGGSSQGSNSSSSSGQQKGQQAANNSQKGGGGPANQLKEPSDSTTGESTGQAVADSDDGSPRAVTKTPNAMPGAPTSTLKGKQQDRNLNSPESQQAPTAPRQ